MLETYAVRNLASSPPATVRPFPQKSKVSVTAKPQSATRCAGQAYPAKIAGMLEDLLQTFWVIVGACSGLMIGLTHEGADLVASLGSVKGWKQIYTGSAPRKAKKLDNGDYRLKPQPASGVVTDTITVLTAFPNKLSLGMQR